MKIIIIDAKESNQISNCFDIRKKVFVEEQGVPVAMLERVLLVGQAGNGASYTSSSSCDPYPRIDGNRTTTSTTTWSRPSDDAAGAEAIHVQGRSALDDCDAEIWELEHSEDLEEIQPEWIGEEVSGDVATAFKLPLLIL